MILIANHNVRPHTALRNMLVHPKDRISDEDKSEVLYKIRCKNCERVYAGETGRPLGERVKEHRKEVGTITGIFTRAEKTTWDKLLHTDNRHRKSVLMKASDVKPKQYKQYRYIFGFYDTPFTQYNRLSNPLSNRFDNRVERTATVRSTGCQTGLYNQFDNRLYTRYSWLSTS